MRLDYTKVSPGGVKVCGSVYGYVVQSGLEEDLIDLVYLRISQINGCAYYLDLHARDLINRGVPSSKLAMLQAWREVGAVFSGRERCALAWAESVTCVAQTHVPDAVFDTAIAVFNDKELVDLTIAVGLMNIYNQLAISFRRVPENALTRKK